MSFYIETVTEIEPKEDAVRIVWGSITDIERPPAVKLFDSPEEAARWLDSETQRDKILFSHRDDEAAIEATLHDPEIYLGKAIFRIRTDDFPTTGIGTQL